ncbi:hypothetical protein CYMTET_43037 [Cymbomonas tetramitiformis]|uniref:Uncharacterized protein n=1 Tax=Cymbomonas tetramitiformis TaxID=36881 RepID=A0AAE0C300_9CHLO|nr:hypothetical protein CYMTET_43037 [Cymbomonas tetramitiformis]
MQYPPARKKVASDPKWSRHFREQQYELEKLSGAAAQDLALLTGACTLAAAMLHHMLYPIVSKTVSASGTVAGKTAKLSFKTVKLPFWILLAPFRALRGGRHEAQGSLPGKTAGGKDLSNGKSGKATGGNQRR